jgi:hypothetical protein
MSIRSRRRRERWVMLTWGLVGLGFGLMLLSTVMWLKQDDAAPGWREQTAQTEALAPLLTKWRQGQLPGSGAGSADMAAWAPLLTALQRLQTQRAQALAQYESQVKEASPSAWLVPAQLVLPTGRQVLATRLLQLDRALSTWTQREAAIQAEFDSAMNAWFQQEAPPWLDLDARQQMMEASGEAARVVHAYVQLEQDLLAQIRHLSHHIDSLGDRVSLANPEQGEGAAELVFAQEVDFNRYQSSVARLSELAEQEQSQMELIRQVDRQHLIHLADAVETSVVVP